MYENEIVIIIHILYDFVNILNSILLLHQNFTVCQGTVLSSLYTTCSFQLYYKNNIIVSSDTYSGSITKNYNGYVY